MNEMPSIVVAAVSFLEHCRYVRYPTEREYAEAVALSKAEAKIEAEALEVLRLYFTEERTYNEPDSCSEQWDESSYTGLDPEIQKQIVFVEEKERDERPTNQPRLED